MLSCPLRIQRVKRTSLLGGRLVLVAHGCQLGLPLLSSLATLLLLLLALGRVLLQPVHTKAEREKVTVVDSTAGLEMPR